VVFSNLNNIPTMRRLAALFNASCYTAVVASENSSSTTGSTCTGVNTTQHLQLVVEKCAHQSTVLLSAISQQLVNPPETLMASQPLCRLTQHPNSNYAAASCTAPADQNVYSWLSACHCEDQLIEESYSQDRCGTMAKSSAASDFE
jgi:hypothetical protein